MATQYGLTLTGFVPKTIELIRSEINQALQKQFGPSVDLSDGSILGLLVGIFSEREGLVWELCEAIYASQDPEAASGAALDGLAALTGTLRAIATSSTVTVTATGTPGSVITGGAQVATLSTSVVFNVLPTATIVALSARTISTAYALGARVTASGNVYVATIAGTSGTGTLSGIGNAIVDGTVTWRYCGIGTGAVDLAATAVNTGAQQAVSGDITVIKNPSGGWVSVINLLDAVPGRDTETDSALRLRRVDELSASGATTAAAIRADILNLPGVTNVVVFVNNTDNTDGAGVPPHAVEVLVVGGVNQTIIDTLFQSDIAAGIATYTGASGIYGITGTSTDSQGTAHTISFSRPVPQPIYVTINVTKDPAVYPADGNAQITKAITDFGGNSTVGLDAVASRIAAQAFKVAGVLDVSTIFIGLAPSPSSATTIPVSLRQVATYDTSRIIVNAVNGVP